MMYQLLLMLLLDGGMLVVQCLAVDITIGETLDESFAIAIGVLLKILMEYGILLLGFKLVPQMSHSIYAR